MHPLDILFVACLAFGGIYTLFTLVMGGLHDIGGHADAGDIATHADSTFDASDFSHADAGVDMDLHAEAHGADHVDGAGEGSHFNILSYLAPMAVAGFLLGFGGVGTMCRMLGLATGPSVLAALSGGMGMWLGAYLFITKFVGASQASSHYRGDDLVGLRGTVMAPIEGSRPGMVAFNVAGRRQQLRAVTEEEEPIPMGANVRIRIIKDNVARVVRLDD